MRYKIAPAAERAEELERVRREKEEVRRRLDLIEVKLSVIGRRPAQRSSQDVMESR